MKGGGPGACLQGEGKLPLLGREQLLGCRESFSSGEGECLCCGGRRGTCSFVYKGNSKSGGNWCYVFEGGCMLG